MEVKKLKGPPGPGSKAILPSQNIKPAEVKPPKKE
jgi:hypothetical protein